MRSRLLLAAILAATAAAYAPSFTASFQYDDFDQIVYNPALDVPPVRPLLAWARSRVIPFATLALNRRLGGQDPLGYHLVNFAVHLLAVFFVFRLAEALCRTPRLRDSAIAPHRLALAGAAAALFALHPIQVQAVTYIVQRITSLAGMFWIGAVYFYVVARNATGAGEDDEPAPRTRRRAYLAAAAMALGAFLSKENSASLPVAILLAEWTFYPGGSGVRRLARSWPFLALLAAIPALWLALPSGTWRVLSAASIVGREPPGMIDVVLRSADPLGQITPLVYFLTQATVIPRYLGLILWPSGLNIDHDVALAPGLSLAVVGGIALSSGLIAAGLWLLRRRPLVGFGILWFFVALSVESSVLPIADVMVEHRLYLPMAGVALVAASAFVAARRAWPRAALVAGLTVLVVLAGLTFARNLVWRTQLSLWSDALVKSPGKARAHLNVGTALQLEGKLDAALPYYCHVLALEPDNPRAHYHLNVIVEKKIQEGTVKAEVETGADGVPIYVVEDPCER